MGLLLKIYREYLSFYWIIVLVSISALCCSENEKASYPNNLKESIISENLAINEGNFKIVKLDSVNGRLFRIFITIGIESLLDSTEIKSVICDVKDRHVLSSNSFLSFFSDEEYADYLDILLYDENGDSHFSREERLKFKESYLNNYFLAEYDMEILTLYPKNKSKRIVKKIGKCSQ